MHLIPRAVTARQASAAIVVALLITAPPIAAQAAEPDDGRTGLLAEARPHVLDGDLAAVVLRVRGASVCSGTPITGTRLVITAAHCVLDEVGQVTPITVSRDGIDTSPRTVLLDPRRHETPTAHFDAAVLVMDRAVPGGSATLGPAVPSDGFVSLVGYQPLDSDGTLLRGATYDDRPTPKGATGTLITIESRPTGCVTHASSVHVSTTQLTVACGLIPGASGGGLFTRQNGTLALIGITSNVDLALRFNGLTPIAAVYELLDHPHRYSHPVPDGPDETARQRAIAS